jgi:hypothetical protein
MKVNFYLKNLDRKIKGIKIESKNNKIKKSVLYVSGMHSRYNT